MTLPIIKWVGGKREMVERIVFLIKPHLRHRYIEPFLGGAAVALNIPTAVIASDVEQDLIEMYEMVRYCHISLGHRLQILAMGHCKEQYYEIRSQVPLRAIDRAARFIYLNKTGFNGLHRKNRLGLFNVPLGRGRASSIPTGAELGYAAEQMRQWQLRCVDFEETISVARDGDVVFADPPYLGTFDKYNALKFDSQKRLRDSLNKAVRRGAFVCSTNSEEALTLYDGWEHEITHERRRIAASGNRAPARCVLLWRQSL